LLLVRFCAAATSAFVRASRQQGAFRAVWLVHLFDRRAMWPSWLGHAELLIVSPGVPLDPLARGAVASGFLRSLSSPASFLTSISLPDSRPNVLSLFHLRLGSRSFLSLFFPFLFSLL
jgi:hypothetical protein